jgi:protease-4
VEDIEDCPFGAMSFYKEVPPMKTLIVAWMILALFIAWPATADQPSNLEPIPSYYTHTDYLLTTPGASGSALGGFINPAVYGLLPGFENQSFWSDRGAKLKSMDRWGLFLGMPHLGFGLVHHRQRVSGEDGQRHKVSITDYRIGLAGGRDAWAFGLGYGWSAGDPSEARRDHLLQAGFVGRPWRQLSIGMTGDFATGNDRRRAVLDLALRPLGTPAVTLFGDSELYSGDRLEDAGWGLGGAVELLPGILLGGKYHSSRGDESYALGLSFSFGSSAVSAVPHYSKEGKWSYTIYELRGGYHTDNIFDRYLRNDQRYFSLPLKGRVAYRKYRYFDADTHTLIGIVSHLQDAIDDPRIAGVAVNLSAADIPREMAWEIREKLREVKEAGKKVVIFIDRGGMTDYHLASVADHIVMDPEGILFLQGFRLGGTYYRGTLHKLGLGVDVMRFYKYKSAGEMFSRDDMSAADREQLQALVDDRYELMRREVSASRGIEPQVFDRWIEEGLLFSAPEALSQGLVDALGRWSDAEDMVRSLEGSKKKLVAARMLAAEEFPSRTWGPRPRIAIVYGLGFCAMDWGIKARQLEGVFRHLEKDGSVKAVVFRVDSPGGGAMASDVISEALKRCAAQKPVIVSQGAVAASGGYHISMYADSIVAAPATVTGSIGVLGAWVWNDGLGDKLGMTTDRVQRGRHADVDFGIWLPLLGVELPDRPLSVEERARFETLIRSSYDLFITKVAEGRGMDREAVEAVAQGRVWSGTDGRENGLVDRLGGLDMALRIAREAAGIGPEEAIEIVELPGKGLFKFDLGGSGVLSQELQEEPAWQYLKLFSEHPGQPLPVLPMGLYEQ